MGHTGSRQTGSRQTGSRQTGSRQAGYSQSGFGDHQLMTEFVLERFPTDTLPGRAAMQEAHGSQKKKQEMSMDFFPASAGQPRSTQTGSRGCREDRVQIDKVQTDRVQTD